MDVREVPRSWLKVRRPRAAMCGILLIALATVAAGCGPPEWEETDPIELSVLISEISEVASSQESLAERFAQGALPPESEWKKFRKYNCHSGLDAIKISGDTATATVGVEDSTGNDMGTQEWTFVREDGAWKVKTAPLP